MIIKFTWAMALCAPHLAAATGTQDRVAYDDQLDRIEPRIVGGSLASEGEYPSYAIPRTGSYGDGLCGSVKIWNDILLSAAHCAGTFVGNDMLIGGNQRSGSDALEVIPAVAERRHPETISCSSNSPKRAQLPPALRGTPTGSSHEIAILYR